ncbi:MAG: dihydroorotase, partial [Myxococcota bacterium]
LGAHLREPGFEYKEDLKSGAAAAAPMARTSAPPFPSARRWMNSTTSTLSTAGSVSGDAEVRAIGAGTLALKGEAMAPVGEMVRAGAVAVGDGHHWIRSSSLMRRLLEYAGHFDTTVISRPSDPEIARGGQIHEGAVSTALGLRGIPRTAEDLAVARDLMVAEQTGGRLHLTGVSTAGAVRQIREAKARGVRVTADANPLHLLLTHDAMFGFPVNLKILPPLREGSDRQALIGGLKDGTVDALCSHHQPQSVMEKDSPFQGAEFGVAALQSTVPLALALVREHEVSESTIVRALSSAPAEVYGRATGLSVGAPAHITVVDPTGTWTLDRETNRSKSVYSPQFGKSLQGRVHLTVRDGVVLFHEDARTAR